VNLVPLEKSGLPHLPPIYRGYEKYKGATENLARGPCHGQMVGLDRARFAFVINLVQD